VQLSVRRGEPRRVAASTTTSTQSAPRIAAEPQTVTLPPLGTTAAQFPPSGREEGRDERGDRAHAEKYGDR
jgi:hypothetical protein